ncbi:hypothetical protein SPRG_03183 [Saprolegnia parasitica CBS 223.65]|uniref:KEN domain-containing protein n=1 Tax=Saprolegnia parasitica (strain CBS 223.65) TaxID=695850 RepID=A0A067CYT2_SAPPC|nr:hypothetical protein SPRG_03183 [Saprolegnia parasitica CBS 223.65]KDO31967.1 hypothetical protein SPRG_03183 [Saprolegnia parasitica CBS 223.65]|eukprot:XP_012197163.1 hypothetical protein SPRG_03183 [Saprolegnia parasitica CBS 223.65]
MAKQRRRKRGRAPGTSPTPTECPVGDGAPCAAGSSSVEGSTTTNAGFLERCAQGDMRLLPLGAASASLEALRDRDGNNGLLLAAFHGHLSLLQGLHASGFNLHVINDGGDNALHLAAFQGHHDVVAWLEQHGVEISVDDAVVEGDLDGWGRAATSSMYLDLVRAGDVASLDALVTNVGAHSFPWAARGDHHMSALGLAAEANQPAMLSYLATTGGLRLDDHVNNRRDTCLHIAAMHGHLDLLRCVAPQVDMEARNAQRWTPMDTACLYGQASIVDYFLAHTGVVVSVAHLALALEGGAASTRMLDDLLQRAPQLVQARHGSAQETLLHIAVSLRQREACNLLLQKGADVGAVDGSGWTPWHVVLHTQWAAGVALLLPPSRSTAATWLPFAVQHASTAMLLEMYDRLASPQALYQAAVDSRRNDVVIAIDARHEAQANAMLSQLVACTVTRSTAPLPSAIPTPVASESTDQPTSETTEDDDDDDDRNLSPALKASPLQVHEMLAIGLARGHHDEWGDVLVQMLSPREAAAVRRYHQQLLRLRSRPASLLRYLGSVDGATDNADTALLFESPASMTQSATDGRTFAGVVDAVVFLHEHGQAHGAITSHCIFLEAGASSKLYVAPVGALPAPSRPPPELHENADMDAFAADVFSLGQALALLAPTPLSAECVDLLDAMTALDPDARPRIDEVRRHPWFWSIDDKLAYLERVANQVSLTAFPPCVYRWQTRLPPAVASTLASHRVYSDTLPDLVRWVRNMKQHSREHAPGVWTALGQGRAYDAATHRGQMRCLGDFVTRAFPDLICRLWRTLGEVA